MPASTPCKTPGRGIILGVKAATNAVAPSINPNGDSGPNKIETITLHRGTGVKAQPPAAVAPLRADLLRWMARRARSMRQKAVCGRRCELCRTDVRKANCERIRSL